MIKATFPNLIILPNIDWYYWRRTFCSKTVHSFIFFVDLFTSLKGTDRSQLIWLKCVTLIQVSWNPEIILWTYTWYHKHKRKYYRLPEGCHYGFFECQVVRLEGKTITCSDVGWYKGHPDGSRSQMCCVSNPCYLAFPLAQPFSSCCLTQSSVHLHLGIYFMLQEYNIIFIRDFNI